MRVARRFAAVVAVVCLCSTAHALDFAGQAAGREVANAVVLTYDPADGNLSVNGGGAAITTFEVKSTAEYFTPESAADVFDPPFDVAAANKLFKLDTAGFTMLDFGQAATPGLSGAALLDDLQVAGSILGGGGIEELSGGGPYLYVVPEPTSLGLLGLGFVGLLAARRRK